MKRSLQNTELDATIKSNLVFNLITSAQKYPMNSPHALFGCRENLNKVKELKILPRGSLLCSSFRLQLHKEQNVQLYYFSSFPSVSSIFQSSKQNVSAGLL